MGKIDLSPQAAIFILAALIIIFLGVHMLVYPESLEKTLPSMIAVFTGGLGLFGDFKKKAKAGEDDD